MPAPPSSQRSKLVFVAPAAQIPFIEQDRETLAKDFDVAFVSRAGCERKQLLQQVRDLLRAGDVALLYIWFVEPYDTPQLLWEARRHGVPTAVVIGGYETVWFPEHGYGALSNWRNKLRMQLSLRMAGLVLPTSQVLFDEVMALAPGVKEKMHLLELGIDSEYFAPGPEPREQLAVTVGRITRYQWRVKGLDVFARASKHLPECRFLILGPCAESWIRESLLEMGGENLEVPGEQMSSAELRSVFQKAQVYAQLSIRESFGVALAEAMACGCTPVVSDAGALPEVVGGTGQVVPYGDEQAAARAIERGLSTGDLATGDLTPRKRVASEYSPERRVQALRELLRLRLGVTGREAAA